MKHIFIGLDGTQNAAFSDTFQTNVYRLGVALNYEDALKNRQLFFYYPGVGTQTANKYLRNLFSVMGDGLDLFILEAYINLVLNYEAGDKLYIFGFSRGALAARALTGLISHAGIVDISSSWLIRLAWEYFINECKDLNYLDVRNGHVHPNPTVDFLGVWDTVAGPYKEEKNLKKFRISNLKMDRSVQNGVHIVSIDESRQDFSPVLWEWLPGCTNPLQVWMPGVHSDIGGGYEETTLANISLLAMIDLFSDYFPQVEFDRDYIKEHIVDRTEQIVINNEWATYALKFLGRKLSRSPKVTDLFHPVTDLVHGRNCLVRGKADKYETLKNLFDGKTKMVTHVFPVDSYWSKIQPRLRLLQS